MFNDLDFSSIPEAVVIDVMQRIMDYMEYEGSEITDPYVQKQIEYAKKFIKRDELND